jgi:hypothetical protein
VPDPSKPETFEDYLRVLMGISRRSYMQIIMHDQGYGIMLALPRADGEDQFSVNGNTVEPLAEPKGG